MSVISLETAAALDALGFEIFDAHLDVTKDPVSQGPATGLTAPSPDMDARLYALIKPTMEAIDGRTPATGFKYTLNVTNALQLRPKKWFIHNLMEYDAASLWPVNVELAYMPHGHGGVYNGVNSFGWSLGLATCASICHAWAAATRMSTQNNYPPVDEGGFIVKVSS